MSTRRSNAFEQLLRKRNVPTPVVEAQAPAIRARGAREAPLSFGQERLWFLDQLEPGGSAYNMPGALRLRGVPDVPALGRALSEIARRHEVLRTTFRSGASGPVQVIARAAPVPLPIVDLAGLERVHREEWLRGLARVEASRPFALAAEPVFRSELVRLDAEEWAVLWTIHHIASDGWSTEVLTREVSALYGAFAAGEPSPLAEPPVQYADFAAWQREHLEGGILEAQLAFWRERLAGAPPLLEIPTDRPRSAVAGMHAGSVHFVLPAVASEALLALAQREGSTPFVLLLTAWQALLGRWSGQDDVLVGTPVAGRTRAELEGLIGFFVNTLVLRADLSDDPSFLESTRRVRQVVLDAQANQAAPFERVVEELGVQRNLTHSPLFQALFSHAESALGRGGLRLGDLTLEPLSTGRGAAKFDLTLSTWNDRGRVGGSLEYRTDLWNEVTAERMLAHYARLLEALAADPEARVDEVELLDEGERAQLAAWSRPAPLADPARRSAPELFAAQAACTPDAVALVFGDEEVSYAELDARAGRVARRLRERGVGPEVRVGVLLERGPDLVAALLGVLRAGGAYVPLDPAYPAERLGYMLADSQARLLVSRRPLSARLPAAAVPLLCLDEPDAEPDAGTDAERASVAAEQLAYVIYTSGSTGRPKGVAVPHGSLAALLPWLREVVTAEERAGVLGSTSASFDVSVAEIFGTLCWGGTLLLAENALALAGLAAAERVRLGVMVPSAAAELLRAGAVPAGVRAFNLAGEALPGALAAGLRALPGVRAVRNVYGPTEVTVYATWAEVGGDDEARPPIGRPVPGVRAYVLDGRGRVAPRGVRGELYLGGAQVARGYLGRPGLTAEKFVPDPFSGEAGARMYRTGDRASWRADGELEYLGRLDQQVKLRGFRIEPGEVEAALLAHARVEQAVVVVHAERLVGYVVASVDEVQLREHLRERLPEYMLPSVFVRLDALPLNPSGKVDRRALPEPAVSAVGSYARPRDVLELRLAGVWEALLGIADVGVHDDFFALGGHSLLAVRLVSHVEALTGHRLPLAAIFAGPTVARMAALLRQEGPGVDYGGPLVLIRPRGTARPLFFVHPAGGNVLAYAALARHLDPDQPLLALQSRGLSGGERPAATIGEMALDYLHALRAAQPEGPYRLGGWSMGGLVAFEMGRRLEAAGEAVEVVVLVDSALHRGEAGEDDPLEPLLDFARHLDLDSTQMGVTREEALAIDPAERLPVLLAAAVAAGVVPPDWDASSLRSAFGVYRANVAAARTYRAGHFGGRVVLLRAETGAMDGDGGWGAHSRTLEIRDTPGDHFGAVREPHVGALALAITEILQPNEAR